MSTPRKATPSDWAWLEGNSTVDRCDAAWSRGLIEHRARLEAMEAAMPMVLQPLTEVREFIPAPVTHDLANAAPLLWVLWNHLGGSSPIGQPIRQYLGMGQFERMTEDQIEAAKQYRDCMAMPTAPSPADSLVEQEVAQQQPEPIDEAENDRRFHACMDLIQNATPEQIRAAAGLPERSALVKRVDPAAIREVADWLDSIELHVAAARLRQEAQP